MITNDKVTEIYCIADDFCHTIELGSNKKELLFPYSIGGQI